MLEHTSLGDVAAILLSVVFSVVIFSVALLLAVKKISERLAAVERVLLKRTTLTLNMRIDPSTMTGDIEIGRGGDEDEDETDPKTTTH